MKVVVSDSALKDLENILAFYNARSSVAATKFLDRLDAVKEQISEWPRSGQSIAPGTRRVLIPGFPVGVFYEVRDVVTIVAVLDLRRNPETLDDRIL